MDYAIYIASALGAIGVWLLMPGESRKGRGVGGVLAIAALAGLLIYLFNHPAVGAENRPSAYYYVFTVIAAASAVRVITHPRPVYSALFFVMVVLSVAGLFILLEAEFMAFAMVIIYAGAILVTYLFVIMLATLPQSANEPDATPVYDRVAREPFSAAVLGFALLAVLASVMFNGGKPAVARTQQFQAPPAFAAAVERTPRRVVPLIEGHRDLLAERGLMPADVDLDAVELQLVRHVQTRAYNLVLLDPEAGDADPSVAIIPLATPIVGEVTFGDLLADRIGNVDRVGVALFEGHTLGIELAGVVLLLSMVGAIVIGRKQVLVEDTATGPATPGAGGATAQPTGEPGPDSPEVLDSTSEGSVNRG